jgi:hypothetical protein
MRTLGVMTGITMEITKELDTRVASYLARLEMACKENNKEIWSRIKSTVISLLIKGAISSLTDNSVINTIADTVVAYNLFKDILLVKKILNKAESYSDEEVLKEVERLNSIEFDIEF